MQSYQVLVSHDEWPQPTCSLAPVRIQQDTSIGAARNSGMASISSCGPQQVFYGEVRYLDQAEPDTAAGYVAFGIGDDG